MENVQQGNPTSCWTRGATMTTPNQPEQGACPNCHSGNLSVDGRCARCGHRMTTPQQPERGDLFSAVAKALPLCAAMQVALAQSCGALTQLGGPQNIQDRDRFLELIDQFSAATRELAGAA